MNYAGEGRKERTKETNKKRKKNEKREKIEWRKERKANKREKKKNGMKQITMHQSTTEKQRKRHGKEERQS